MTSPKEGIPSRRRRSMAQPSMLDKRDIQTLMYCVRLAEASGQWREASPSRSPHDLECKLARLLHEIEDRGVVRAA
jgi:hypothetical protein